MGSFGRGVPRCAGVAVERYGLTASTRLPPTHGRADPRPTSSSRLRDAVGDGQRAHRRRHSRRLHARRGADRRSRSGRSRSCGPADAAEVAAVLRRRGRARRAGDGARCGHRALGRVHPARRRHRRARSTACSASSRSTSTTTCAVVEAGRDARPARRGARAARPRVSRVPRREQRVASAATSRRTRAACAR